MNESRLPNHSDEPQPLTRDLIASNYYRHAHCVLRRARRFLGSEAEAQEVLQELFLSLLERPEQFRGRSSLLTWLYSATTHLCLNRLRNGNARTRLLESSRDAVPQAGPVCAPDREAELRRFLRKLPIEIAAIAAYFYVDALTYDEIADVTGHSRRKVAYQLERMRELAKQEGFEHE